MIFGIQTVELNPGRDIGSIQILVFQTLFHSGQMNQIKHLAPVHSEAGSDGLRGLFNGLLYQLHLFDPVADQRLLKLEGGQHKMIIRIRDCHFVDILQREPEIF